MARDELVRATTERGLRRQGGPQQKQKRRRALRRSRWGFLAVAVVAFSASVGNAGSEGFHTGDAQASADTFSLSLKAANATIGFTYGRSLASYQDRTGTAEARALDLGALPVIFAAEQCDGTPGPLSHDTLPQLTRADSSEAGADASRRTQVFVPGLDGGPVGDPVGFQDAKATPLPSSWASTESVPADIGLIAIEGGRTEVTTRLEGQLREAHAVSSAAQVRVLGGLFSFNDVRWEATAQSGSRTTATGSFTFGSATVLGFPRSPADALADFQGFKAGLEQLLAPLGVVLELPQVEVRDDGVRVTPMGFRIVNPPFGTQLLTPFLGQIDPLVQQWRKDLLAQDCKNANLLTVVDIILGALGGSGAIEALAGGVDVSTHDVDYSIPPIPPLPEPVAAPVETVPEVPMDDSTLGSEMSAFDSGTSLDSSMETMDLSTPLGTAEIAAPTPKVAGEQATLPAASLNRFEDGSAGTAGVAVGVLALLGALALSMGDRLVGRRSKRTIP